MEGYFIRYFFLLIISLLAISCSSSSGDTCKGKIFIYPDSINVSDIRIKGLRVQNIYDPHNQCLHYISSNYAVFHFIESCNTYIEKIALPQVLIDQNGILLYSTLEIISSMWKNRDFENIVDVERYIQNLHGSYYHRVDTSIACMNDIFQIEYLPLDTSKVDNEKHIISDCAIYQEKLMEIHNALSKDALAIFLFYSESSDIASLLWSLYYLIGPEDNMQLLKLDFVKECYGTYIYQPYVDMYL